MAAVAVSSAHVPDEAEVERRAGQRRQPAVGTVCRFELGVEAKPSLGLVWNLSHGGVSLLVNQPIPPGTELTGELETLNHTAKLPVSFRVAHLTKLLTGDYCVGAQFSAEVDDAALKPFLASPKPEPR